MYDALTFVPSFGVLTTRDETLSTDKYTMAITKATEIINLHLTNKVSPRPEIKERIYSRTDRLLGFFLSQFQTEAVQQEVSDTLESSRQNTLDALDISTLTEMGEGCVPVAIIRELFFKNRIALDLNRLSNWKVFADRYAVVLKA